MKSDLDKTNFDSILATVLREQAEKLSPVICLHENKDFKCLRKG
jgi:hypothetical protein